MRSIASPERAVAPLAASFLEAGWIVLAYLVVEVGWAGTSAPLPGLAFAAAAFLGLAMARWLWRDRRAGREPALAVVALAIAVIGCAVPLASIGEALGGPFAVLRAHPGGMLLGLAFIRGTAHTSTDDDARIADLALGPGLVALATGWLLITFSDVSRVPWAMATAFVATVAFVTSALVSLGLSRLAAVRRLGVTGADRTMWVALVGLIACALVAFALPLALVIGMPIEAAARSAASPVPIILRVVGLLVLVPAAIVVAALAALLDLLHRIVGYVPTFHPPPIPDTTLPLETAPSSGGPDLAFLLLVIVPIIAAAAFVALTWLIGRPHPVVADPDVVEVRESEPAAPFIHLRRPRIARRRHRRDPSSASEAYLSSLELLAERETWARRSTETPGEHARRVGTGRIAPIRPLAADYVLAEFAHRPLSENEHARAIARWRSIAQSLSR